MGKIDKELERVNNKFGGSTLTKVAREHSVHHLRETLRSNNVNVVCLEELKAKHVEKYIQHQKDAGVSLRTLQNRMAHIRTALKGIQRNHLAEHERLSSKALGINGASRNGTHKALTVAQYEDALKRAQSLGRPEVVAAIELQRTFGLRASEAIQSGKSLRDWLTRLESQQSENARVRVLHGTKGGRVRDSTGLNGAIDVLKRAIAACDKQTGNLFTSASLEGARRSYQRACAKIDLKGEYASHSLRYSYAQDIKAMALRDGLSEAEARSLTSLELGHGDGRGTYVEQVYAQR